MPRHSSREFIAFLSDLVTRQPEGQQIHVICGNVSAHETKDADDFLAAHPNVQIHHTPTCASWLTTSN